jgi:hypothetical protein
MEDVTLSLQVGKHWQLANARTARIFHDSQPGDHKSNASVLAKMGLVNRHYVMTEILDRRSFADYLKLGVLQLFEVAALLQTLAGWQSLTLVIEGKVCAIWHLLTQKLKP